ncbi:hypothetical protein AU184_14965 [Mycolicibacterium novocastrense]|uniref:hypothetical protein n=1 Tax=Mycolicibacterium novocastrense TaxID=59813 RepID=UPI000747265A|nr:hypothetical protein [Mycolicibacterium novocastrense]KUH70086.1 hypothetical protein AU183_11280 [Mycolicibacterium novocastrense]KUH78259.1 hypothetical protein AU072_10045 [Mycolicibacterium novocastrense]KUH79594.1 hypothetical protein AU184_14965 [Mycolicibacterium novocastrense]
MRTTLRHLAPVIAAGGIVAALAAAAPAVAEPAPNPNPTLPQCVDTGGAQAIGGSTTECVTPGNVSINATPAEQEYVGPWGSMWEGDGFFFP